MLHYQEKFMQLNWATAEQAHVAVLTDIERGHTSCSDQPIVGRIRQRFTQRAMTLQANTAADE